MSSGKTEKVTLPAVASICTAELHAIRCAISIAKGIHNKKVSICSDSLSSIKAINSYQPLNQLVIKIKSSMDEVMREGKEIRLMWTPGHSGIERNNKADEEKKKAAIRESQFITVPFTDLTSLIRRSKYEVWKKSGDKQDNHCIK